MKTKNRIWMIRTTLGRFIIHMGLRVLPRGPVRSELYNLIDQWATDVYVRIGRQ